MLSWNSFYANFDHIIQNQQRIIHKNVKCQARELFPQSPGWIHQCLDACSEVRLAFSNPTLLGQ